MTSSIETSSTRTESSHAPPVEAPDKNKKVDPTPAEPAATPRKLSDTTSRARKGGRKRRWLPWVGALIVLALIIAGLWPKPLAVETGKAVVGPLRATVNEEGKTRIKQRYVVSAPVVGQLRRIPFKAGAQIKADETVVAVIDPPAPTILDARSRAVAEARRDTAAANVERARAQHHFAQVELQRMEKLASDKTVSDQQLEDAQLRETAAAKELAAFQSALRQAEVELAEFNVARSGATHQAPVEIRAPTSGRVLKVFEESTRTVTVGTPLMEIGDPADLEVIIETLSRDGAAISPGTRVLLEHWGGETPLEARVRLVEPAAFTKISALGVEEQRVNVVADIITPVEQRASLGDSFRVEARIVVWETDNTLKVPAGALFRQGAQWSAFTLEGGKAVLRDVQVGRTSGVETQVLNGLKEGDEVILYPGDRIKPGQRLKRIKV